MYKITLQDLFYHVYVFFFCETGKGRTVT